MTQITVYRWRRFTDIVRPRCFLTFSNACINLAPVFYNSDICC